MGCEGVMKMKINIKFLKGMISAILASVMTTSCFVGPVGAFKASTGASQEFIDKVAILNLKIDNYKASLMEAWDKVGDFLKQTREASKNNGKKVEKMEKILRYVSGKLKHLMERQYYTNPNNKCLDDLKNELTVYDESCIGQISEILDDFESEITLLINKVDGLSLDIDKDKVFYTEKTGIINLDENEDNSTKKELKYAQMKNFFGNNADRLTNKMREVYKLAVDGMNQKLKNDIQNIPVEDTMCLMNLNKKMEEYEAVRSDFEDVKRLLRVNGRCPKDLKLAIRVLTGGDGTRISTEKNSEFIKNKQSMEKAIHLIDNAIKQMKDFMAGKLAKNMQVEKDKIFATLTECIDELASEEHVRQCEAWANDARLNGTTLKEVNAKLLSAFLKLKSLEQLVDDEGKQLITDFREICSELTLPYYSYDGRELDDLVKESKEYAQKAKGKLAEILKKAEQIKK